MNYADINNAVNIGIRSRVKDLRNETGIITTPYCSHKRLKTQLKKMQEVNGEERIGLA